MSDYKVESIEEVVIDRYADDPIALLLVGSSVVDSVTSRDLDFVLIDDGQYAQQYFSTTIEEQPIQIDVWKEAALTSLFDQYFWHPDKLVAELGKFGNCKLLAEYAESEGLEDALSTARDVPDQIRLFILSYHLGYLNYQCDADSPTSPGTIFNPEWHVLSIIASIEDRYPPSLRYDIVRDVYGSEYEPILSTVRDGDWSDLSTDIINPLIKTASETTLMPEGEAPSEDLPLYYPPNAMGFDLLDIDYPQWRNDSIVEFKPRG